MTGKTSQPSFDDRTDFDNAWRGFVAALAPCVVKSSNGRIVWDNDAYSFLQEKCPPQANAKLWRQGQLNSIQGLFQVTDKIFQVRGFDLSNMTIVEGKEGVIVIDPLTTTECAAAALDFYFKHRGVRRVTGLIYSHSHVDHYGGARGVLPQGSSKSGGSIPIIAPTGFTEEAISENIIAGPAMRRRAAYMYGSFLPKGPQGQIGVGLGMAASQGATSLVAPNRLICRTGEKIVVDGMEIVFQLVPETEAPAEMNFFFPGQQALCIAECATHCLHNVITLRGALVRDAKAWSKYLHETIELFGRQSDVLFGGHNWPTWGCDEIVKMVSEQRDLYAYLHDQTIRMMNRGLTGIEIAETMHLPESLQRLWHTQGFYGSVSHNVKGIYQRYLTWFDGNPAHLWQHPPAEEGRRYVACMGGIEEVVRKAQTFTEEGDLRFAATLLDHAVSSDQAHEGAKFALAAVFEQLGHGAENATWRNFYLTEALRLRRGKQQSHGSQALSQPSVNAALSMDQCLDVLSVRLDGPRAEAESFAIDLLVVDERRRWRLSVNNGALTYISVSPEESFSSTPDLSISLTKAGFLEVLEGKRNQVNLTCDGDDTRLSVLLSLLSIEHSPANSQNKL